MDADSESNTVQMGPRSLLDYRHRVTVEEFHRMIDLGVFSHEPRMELLDGVIIDKMTKSPPHVTATDLLGYCLHHTIPVGYFITMGTPLTIDKCDSEPEPDSMVLRGSLRDYTGRRRTPQDAVLVVEVSDTSYAYDHYQKWAAYAAARVPVYWLLDLNRRRLEFHSDPIGEGTEAAYRTSRLFLEIEEAPLVLDGREVARFAVKDILP